MVGFGAYPVAHKTEQRVSLELLEVLDLNLEVLINFGIETASNILDPWHRCLPKGRVHVELPKSTGFYPTTNDASDTARPAIGSLSTNHLIQSQQIYSQP